MFFSFSKIFWIIAQPLNFLAILFLIALFLYLLLYQRMARRVLIFTAALFLIFGIMPVGSFTLKKLENWYPRPHISQLPDKIDGIIVLGGMLDSRTSADRNYPIYNTNANRMIDFLKLHRAYPDAKAVITGGQGALFPVDESPNDFHKQTLKALGFDLENIIFENDSNNTFENAVESKKLVRPEIGENWILITSAFHMPRSVAVFCSNGWPVIPYPAGHITSSDSAGSFSLGVLDQYYKLHVALKEGIGILAYKVFNKTSVYLPPNNERDSSNVTPVSC